MNSLASGQRGTSRGGVSAWSHPARVSKHSALWGPEARAHAVVGLIPAELVGERAVGVGFVDHHQLGAGYGGEVGELLDDVGTGRSRVAESRLPRWRHCSTGCRRAAYLIVRSRLRGDLDPRPPDRRCGTEPGVPRRGSSAQWRQPLLHHRGRPAAGQPWHADGGRRSRLGCDRFSSTDSPGYESLRRWWRP